MSETFHTLQGLTGLHTAAQVIAALEQKNCPVDKSAYSRYLAGVRTPEPAFAAALYALAADHAGVGQIGMSIEEVQAIRAAAGKKASCAACRNTAAENAALAAETETLRTEVRMLRVALDQAGLSANAPSEESAGPSALDAAGTTSAKLPVAPEAGDRQAATLPQREREASGVVAPSTPASTALPVPAALELVRRVTALDPLAEGDSRDSFAALTLLLETTESLTPSEMSATTSLLQESGREELAGSLITAYARRREAADVLDTALALYDAGASASLHTLLMTAARQRQ